MNKSELVNAVAASTGLTKTESANAVDAVVDAITEAIKRGESVTLVGFGTFEVKDRAPRIARNPKTNEKMEIPARKVPGFKPGKGLKDALA